jgi:plasmid stabilization system protein ParE
VKLRLLDLAEADLVDGYRFYERQSPGVGAYFFETLCSDIESLRLYAGIHRRVFGCNRLLSKRFPFAVYYTVENDEVQIWRVLDCRRDPQWIQAQVGKGRIRRP